MPLLISFQNTTETAKNLQYTVLHLRLLIDMYDIYILYAFMVLSGASAEWVKQ